MKVVVAGSGAREHAIAWKVSQSTLVSELIAAPGNPGMALLGRTVAQDPLDGAGFCALGAGSERGLGDRRSG